MDITAETGGLYDNHPLDARIRPFLLDIAIVNPCASSNLANAAHVAETHLTDAVERMKTQYGGSFPATYSLVPLALLTCGGVGADVHALIKKLAIRWIENRL